MKKEQMLNYLTNVKNEHQKESFIIKALFETTPEFAAHYRFGTTERINEIQKEMRRTAKKFIIDRVINA